MERTKDLFLISARFLLYSVFSRGNPSLYLLVRSAQNAIMVLFLCTGTDFYCSLTMAGISERSINLVEQQVKEHPRQEVCRHQVLRKDCEIDPDDLAAHIASFLSCRVGIINFSCSFHALAQISNSG